MTPTETKMMLTNLLSMYPNHTVNDFATDQWCRSMQNVAPEAAYAAMNIWIDTQKWFPTVSEFKELVADHTPGLPSTAEAWAMVEKRIKSTYPGHTMPGWNVPYEVQEATRAIGGLRAIRLSEKPDDMRRQFEKAYAEQRHEPVALIEGWKALT